jgi:hypothetical protein
MMKPKYQVKDRRQVRAPDYQALLRNSSRRAFERLLIEHPELPVGGLWEHGSRFYVLCDGGLRLSESADSPTVSEWLEDNREITVPPLIPVARPPDGAVELGPRTMAERVQFVGEFQNLSDFSNTLGLELDRSMPRYVVFTSKGGELTIDFARELNDEERQRVVSICQRLVPGVGLVIGHAPDLDDHVPERTLGLQITSSIHFPADMPHVVRHFAQDDEDRWLDHRTTLYASADSPRVRRPRKLSRCFVNATIFEPPNIRSVMPIHQEIIIAPPIADRMDENFGYLGITREDFYYLVGERRLRVVLPESLERYDSRFLAELLDRCGDVPGGVMGPRKLTIKMVEESKVRMPLLFPGVELVERRAALRHMYAGLRSLKSGDPRREVGAMFIDMLKDAWLRQEINVQGRGPSVTAISGVAHFMSTMLEKRLGRDLRLELMVPSMNVETSAVFDATAVPHVSDGYNDQMLHELCATFYAGIPGGASVFQLDDVRMVLDGILGIDDDVPIREILEAFAGVDAMRLEKILSRLVSLNQDPDYLREAVEEFNSKVRVFRRRSDNLTKFGVTTAASAITAVAAVAGSVPLWVPFSIWITHFLVQGPNYGGIPGFLLDTIRAANARTSADAVLVSRLRRRLEP